MPKMQKKILMIDEDARSFDELYELFVVSKTASGVTDSTLINYHYHRKAIAKFIDTKKPMCDITKRELPQPYCQIKTQRSGFDLERKKEGA